MTMNTIAFLDLLAIVAYAASMLIVLFAVKAKYKREFKWLLLSILLLSMLYGAFEFTEWFGKTQQLEPYKNFIGVLIPMMWGYFFYNIIQHVSSLDLVESKNRLDLAVKGTRAGLWDWDIQSGRHIVNERWAEIIGYTLEELEPMTIASLEKFAHPADLKKSAWLVQKHFDKETDFYECEVRIRHKDGHWIWALSRGMVVSRDAYGNPLRMTGTYTDISRQKKVEEDLKKQRDENLVINERYQSQNKQLEESLSHIKEINEQLVIAKEKAEESDQLKSAFLSNMSHEIRTPMNGIIGFSTMLTKDKLSDEKRLYYANIIINSGNQLLTIVNDILDISRIETGRLDIIEEQVDLSELVDDVRTFFIPLAEDKNLALRTFKDPSINSYLVMTDKIRLRQVISNLVHNAIKFTNEGSVEFGYMKDEGQLQFWVKDTGIGIPEDKLHVIFEPFRQIELEITRVPGGTGLGLSISRGLVKVLGGKIWLESQPGKGTVFYFTLPWKPVLSQYHEDIEDQEVPFTKEHQNRVILHAEDDEVSSQFVQEALKQLEPRFVHVKNGIEAVEHCKNNNDIDLVLMDIKMPLMNGYNATRQIKALRPDLPVIALTAFAKEEDRMEALGAGCTEHLVKPVKAKDLLFCVIQNLNGNRQHL